MKNTPTEITLVIQETCNELQSLKTTIGDDLSIVNPERVGEIIDKLHKSLNTLVRQINQSKLPVEVKVKSHLLQLMQAIQKSPAFSQALGQHQAELMNLFKRVKSALSHY